jgi:hypothetical protein
MQMTIEQRISRVKRLAARQPCSSWSQDYQPATRATRQEAPAWSIPRILRGKVKVKRDLHAMSSVEGDALLVALYEPSVVDIHEQKVLQFDASPNPMVNHPLLAAKNVQNLPGMYWAYQQLEAEDLYPIIKQKGAYALPDLLEGDLLLYVAGSSGLHCVNWTVKRHLDQFAIRRLEVPRELQTPEEAEKAMLRHAAEELYYQAADIPTIRVTKDTFPNRYISNLRRCYISRSRLTGTLVRHLPDAALLLNNVRGTGDTGVSVGSYFCRKRNITSAEWVVIFFSVIWEKHVPVDMFSPLFIDRPLSIKPLGQAPLAPLFARVS